MYRHSWFSALLGVGTNILILMTIIGVSWSRFRLGGATSMESFEEEMEEMESEVEDIIKVEEESSSTAPPQDEDDLQAVEVQSICNKLKWFFIRKSFKVLFESFKGLIVVTIAIVCFEAFVQGSEANWEKVMALANFGVIKVKQLAAVVMDK